MLTVEDRHLALVAVPVDEADGALLMSSGDVSRLVSAGKKAL
jgi:hypothetical protein